MNSRKVSRGRVSNTRKPVNPAYAKKGGSPLRNPSGEGRLNRKKRVPTKQSTIDDEVYDMKRQERLRRQINEKEKELAALIGSTNRVKDRMAGSGTRHQTQEDDKFDKAVRIARRSREKKEAVQDKLKSLSRSPLKKIAKSPALGGGLRSQKYQQSMEENLRIDSQERNEHSPLRQKIGGANSGSRSRSPYDYNLGQQIASQAMQLTNQIHTKIRESSPLRQKQSRSPPEMRLIDRYEEPVRERDSYQLIRPQEVKMFNETHQTNHSLTLATRQAQMESKLRDKIETLRMDNGSIKRRMELVRIELEKVRQERDTVIRHLRDKQDEVDRINNQIQQEQGHDSKNRLLEDQIAMERRENERLHKNIADYSQLKSQADMKMVQTITDKKSISIQLQDMSHDLNQKIYRIEEQSRAKQSAMQEISMMNQQFEVLTRDQAFLQNEVRKFEQLVNAAAANRMELHDQLEGQTNAFHERQRQGEMDQQLLIRDTQWRNKQIVAKIIFNVLEVFQYNTKLHAFVETRQFSDFDKTCYTRLKLLTLAMQKLGYFKQKEGLMRWYNSTMKPMGTILQNDKLAIQTSERRLKSRIFFAWREYHEMRINIYKSKTNSINLIWEKLMQGAQQEQKRALCIWKESNEYQTLKNKKISHLLFQRKKYVLSQAVLSWKNYSYDLGSVVRIQILKLEYANKFYLSSLFGVLKQQTFLMRQKRHRKMRLVIKGWHDYMSYRKQIVKANLQAIKFARAAVQSNLQAYFDALKTHKEMKKHEIMNQALKADMDVALESFTAFNTKSSQEVFTRRQRNACSIVRDMFGKQLYSYFHQWKQDTSNYNSKMSTKIRDQVISAYRNKMRVFFAHWKKNSSKKKIARKRMKMTQIQQETVTMETEHFEMNNKLENQAQAVASTRNKHNTKVMKKFQLRIQWRALMRWREQLEAHKRAEARTNQMFGKVRVRLLKESFGIYKNAYLKAQQHGKNERSADFMKDTLDMRTMRKVYSGWLAYLHHYSKAKKQCKRILHRMELWEKGKIFKRWRENGNEKYIHDLQQLQSQTATAIENQNKSMGNNEYLSKDQEKNIENIEMNQKRKAHKLLANYIMRYYNDNTQMRFKHWKDINRLSKHKDSVLRRSIEHMRMAQMAGVRSAFKSFVSYEVRKQRKEAIKQVIFESEEHVQNMVHQENQMVEKRKKVQAQQVRSSNQMKLKQQKFDKTKAMITRRNQNLVFASRKRYIFESWRHVSRQQKGFLLCVINVLEKSMTNKGFHYIKNVARETRIQGKQYRHLNMFILRFLKTNMGDFFNKWKNAAREIVDNRQEVVEQELAQTEEMFASLIKRTKKQNCKNAKHFVDKTRLKRLWQSWVKTCKQFKTRRIQNEEIVEVLAQVHRRKAIQKWVTRIDHTKRVRFSVKQIKHYHQERFKRSIFEAFRVRRAIHVDLAVTISNLEKLFRDKTTMDTFNTIKSFSRSKKLATTSFKRKALEDSISILTQKHIIWLRKYFCRYKAIIKVKHNNGIHTLRILKKIDNANLRCAFEIWRKQNVKILLAEDLNQTGPVTEQVFEANRTIRNLKSFMAKENYTPEEIAKKVKEVEETNRRQMEMVVKRLKIPKGDRVMCRAFGHWVFWIKIKRLMKYHLRFANHSVQPVLCDLRWAFEKWKRSDKDKAAYLDTFDFEELADMNVKQAKGIDLLADREAENSTMINHLNIQRDELLEHFIRAQKLAMSALRDNQRKSMRQSISIWKEYSKACSKDDGAQTINMQVNQITEIKQRITYLEKTNDTLAKENDQLRQFSLDGFQIAKSVQQLSQEREKLSVDLADKSKTISDLLVINKKLRQSLADIGVLTEDDLGRNNNPEFQNLNGLKNN